jgi:RNA polymerase primary sigma factor
MTTALLSPFLADLDSALRLSGLPDRPPTADEERAYSGAIRTGRAADMVLTLVGPDGALVADLAVSEPGEPDRLRALTAHGRRAREEFILRNIPFALDLAGRACRGRRGLAELPDVFSAACAGLVRAVDTFDGRSGWRFSTHAGYWIRQHMQDHRSADRLIRVPRDIARGAGCDRGPGGAADETGRPPDAGPDTPCLAAARVALAVVSSGPDDEGRCPVDAVPSREVDTAERVMSALDRAADQARGRGWVASLAGRDPRMLAVIEARYPPGGGRVRTRAEVAGELGISKTRVGQIEDMAIGRLRKMAEARS